MGEVKEGLGSFFAPKGGLRIQPSVSTWFQPWVIDCLEKHRSLVRTKYRLEAYATLRRRVVAVGSRRLRQDVLERSLDTPESNDRGRESECSPSLRTGQAVFQRPALQLMGSTVRLRAS